MNIYLSNTGKRFNREWIFRKLDYQFLEGKSYAITGTNGSGKSTLLRIIAGATLHSEGNVEYFTAAQNEIISAEDSYKQIAIAAPYLDLVEEMTATEFLTLHNNFKPFTTGFAEMLQAVGLQKAAEKQIRYYSSGMKQRLKLAQAFFSKTSVLLLDEPTTNLDEEGIEVYKRLWAQHTTDRLVIVSSNDKTEYENCNNVVRIGDYK